MKTSELQGAALDWSVAWAEGRCFDPAMFRDVHDCGRYNYATDWSRGGPIIEREVISVMPRAGHRPLGIQWAAERSSRPVSEQFLQFGPTPLIAAMRCYVASKLGDTIDIPEDLQSC